MFPRASIAVFLAVAISSTGNRVWSQEKNQAAVSSPPSANRIEAHFTAKVEWIEFEGNRDATVVPIGFDAHFLVGIEILSLEKPVRPFDKKRKIILLVHSPAILFNGEEQEKVPGKTYSFKVFGDGSQARAFANRARNRLVDIYHVMAYTNIGLSVESYSHG